jgi:hypothetical protein
LSGLPSGEFGPSLSGFGFGLEHWASRRAGGRVGREDKWQEHDRNDDDEAEVSHCKQSRNKRDEREIGRRRGGEKYGEEIKRV